MSKVSLTMCDGCRKEITNKPFEPNLALVVYCPSAKTTAHFCYDCAVPLFNTIRGMAEKQVTKNENSDN